LNKALKSLHDPLSAGNSVRFSCFDPDMSLDKLRELLKPSEMSATQIHVITQAFHEACSWTGRANR
jgi:hypothetical protein